MGIDYGYGHFRAQDGVVLELNGVPEQGFLEEQGQLPGDFPVAGAAGFLVAVGADAAGVENIVILRQAAPGQLLEDMVHQVGVLILQADDEGVGKVFHIGAADSADGRAHLHGFAVHQHADILLQAEAAQGGDDGVLPHYFLPEHPVGELHRHMDGVGQLAGGDGFNQAAHALAGQEAAAGKGNPHIPHRVFEKVGGGGSGVLSRQQYRDIFQGFLGIGGGGRAAHGIKGDGVVGFVQAKGHRVEVVFGAVDAVGNGVAAAAAVGDQGFPQGLEQHNVIVHGIDPFRGVGIEVQQAGQFAVGQFNHNGQGAFAVEGGADGDQGGVGDGAAEGFDPGQAEGGLNGDAVVLLDLEHCDGQRPHLVFAQVVKAQVQGQAFGGGLEHQLGNAQFFDAGLQIRRQVQIFEPVGDGNLHNVRGSGVLAGGQVKGQLPPHIGQLEVVGAKEELAGVERAAGGVADLAVGLDDGLAGGEMFPHFGGDAAENCGEQGLIFGAEREGVAVGGKAVDIVLGQVGTAHHAQLAEKAHTAAVQAHGYAGPGFGGGAAGGVGFLAGTDNFGGLGQDLGPFRRRQVLKDRHIGDQPLVGGVEVFAVGPLPLAGQGDQFIQSPTEVRVRRRRRQGRFIGRIPLQFGIFLSHFDSSCRFANSGYRRRRKAAAKAKFMLHC